MSTNTHPSFFSRLLNMFGGDKSQSHDNLEHAGDRDGALTMSEEPTAEEVARVASEKNDPHHRDS